MLSLPGPEIGIPFREMPGEGPMSETLLGRRGNLRRSSSYVRPDLPLPHFKRLSVSDRAGQGPKIRPGNATPAQPPPAMFHDLLSFQSIIPFDRRPNPPEDPPKAPSHEDFRRFRWSRPGSRRTTRARRRVSALASSIPLKPISGSTNLHLERPGRPHGEPGRNRPTSQCGTVFSPRRGVICPTFFLNSFKSIARLSRIRFVPW